MTLFFAVCKMVPVLFDINGGVSTTEHWYLVDRERDLWSNKCEHATSFHWHHAAEVAASCGPGAYLTDQNGMCYAVDRGQITSSAKLFIMLPGEMKNVTPRECSM